MKNILKFGFLSLLAIISFTACEDDGLGGTTDPGGGGGTDPSDPSVVLVQETGFVDSEATLAPGTIFSVKLRADRGDDPLKAITIKENGVNVDITRISFDGDAAFANPTLITNASVDGFETQIDIVAHDGESTSTYSFEILDEADKVVTAAVNITTINDVVITPPIILIEGSGMAMVTGGTKFRLPVTVSNVTDSLYSLAILENGNYMDPLRLWYGDDSVQFPSNPLGIPDSDVFGFMRDMIILTSTVPGVKTYTIEIEDVAGEVYMKEFTLETEATGSPVVTLEGVLFNRAGPAGTGGLDLDTGNGTGSSDVEAEIKDEGIDSGPLASNWLRRISGTNGATVKHLFKGQNGLPDNYDFANVTTSEQVSALFDNGEVFVDANTAGELVSFRVEVGDEFIVRRDAKNYLIKVTQINETVDDNGDNYVIDIKF